MSRRTLLELTCDINTAHPMVTVVSWGDAVRQGWAHEPVGVYRCPQCTAAPARPARAETAATAVWDDLYREHKPTVYKFIYSRTGNRQLAEDLTSETFARGIRCHSRWEDRGISIGAWLVTIARNLVFDHFKSGRHRFEVMAGDALDADREDHGPEGSPESVVVDHLTNTVLLAAVKRLNPEQQECIVLRFLKGLSIAETALAMGKAEGAVKGLQARGVRAIAAMVEAADGGITLRPQECPEVIGVPSAAEVRGWARQSGLQVPEVGRLRGELIAAYGKAGASC